jgi:hypothetical protein
MTTSKISVFLRGATDELSKVLRDNGFLSVPPERENELTVLLEKFNEEMYGSPSAGSPRRKQTDVRVMTETPVVYDRDYLTKQSVQELLRIAKAKGCKNLGPRKKESLIEKLLQHFTTPHLADAEEPKSEASSQESDGTTTDAPTDDELRLEPVPVPAVADEAPKEKKPRKKKESTDEPVHTGDLSEPEPAKKGRKKKDETEPKPEKKKKEKSDDESKPKAERKKKEKPVVAPAPVSDEDEVTIAVRSWIHPKEQDKPPTERTRYCIDPITNNIYNPDQLTDEPIGRWDEDAQEIIPC